MAGFVCRCMLVFVGLSCISVNLSVPHDNSINIFKQPYGRKMCVSLCQSIIGCSTIEYAYDSHYCHVTSDTTSTSSDEVERGATSEELKPLRKPCPQHSRILTTRKGHRVCVIDKQTDVHRFQMTEPRSYYLGDYNIEVIGRTSLFMRLNASGQVDLQVTFWHGSTYGKQVTIGQDIRVLIHEPNNTHQEEYYLSEPFWKSCGFTELWFRWNNAGFLSLGKGWIPGRNVVIKYDGKINISFSKVTLNPMPAIKRRSDNEVITVEVKHDNHRSTISNCSDDKSKVRFKMDITDSYVLNDYGVPIIGQSSVVLTFDLPHRFTFHFSQKHDFNNNEDIRRVTIVHKKTSCSVGIKFCVGVPPGAMFKECKKNFKKKDIHRYRSDDEKYTTWLAWDQTGYLSLGTGRRPGVNKYIEYQGNSTLLVNYITIEFYYEKNSVNVTACNKY